MSAVCVYVPLVFLVSVGMVPLVSVSVNCVATVRCLDASDVGECTQCVCVWALQSAAYDNSRTYGMQTYLCDRVQ